MMLHCSHMGSVNKVILVGNLGRDAETKFTPSGASVTNFSIATTRRWKDQASGEWKEQTDWHRVKYWRAENVANYLLKGKQVYVEGRLETRSYDDKDGKKVYTTKSSASTSCFWAGGRTAEARPPTSIASSRYPCRVAPAARLPCPTHPLSPSHRGSRFQPRHYRRRRAVLSSTLRPAILKPRPAGQFRTLHICAPRCVTILIYGVALARPSARSAIPR